MLGSVHDDVLAKEGPELFRELLRVYAAADYEDYRDSVTGKWNDEEMRVDLQIIVMHRMESGSEVTTPIEDVEMPEIKKHVRASPVVVSSQGVRILNLQGPGGAAVVVPKAHVTPPDWKFNEDEEGVEPLEKSGHKMFRELKRVFMEADVEDYYNAGKWNDELMKTDFQILEQHRKEFSSIASTLLSEVEIELPQSANVASNAGPATAQGVLGATAAGPMRVAPQLLKVAAVGGTIGGGPIPRAVKIVAPGGVRPPVGPAGVAPKVVIAPGGVGKVVARVRGATPPPADAPLPTWMAAGVRPPLPTGIRALGSVTPGPGVPARATASSTMGQWRPPGVRPAMAPGGGTWNTAVVAPGGGGGLKRPLGIVVAGGTNPAAKRPHMGARPQMVVPRGPVVIAQPGGYAPRLRPQYD